MLSSDERNRRWDLIKVRAPVGEDVRALRADHEAAIRGLRKLAIEKWQALAGGKGHSMPDEKWIEETIDSATRGDVIDRLQLAEGDNFDEGAFLASEARVRHDQGLGPDYAVEIHDALHQDDGLPTK